MDKNTRRLRKTELRRGYRNKTRQDLLISEYVQLKYYNIYSEAAEFYNQINRNYPTKYDLRKTYEFRKWRASITGETVKEPKKRAVSSRPKHSHPDIEIVPFENLDPIEINPEAEIVVTCVEQTSDTADSSPQTPDTTDSSPQTPDTTDTPSTPVKSRLEKYTYKDNLQLKIPLISFKTQKTPPVIGDKEAIEPAVMSETLQIVTEEIIDEDTIQPSLHEELSQDLIQKIIDELRTEPDLKDIFTSVEEQIEFEQLGMDIDIDIEGNALDIELEQW